MNISEELRNRNVAEYLLYMWQQEDLVRAYGLDIDRIEKEYLSRFDVDDEQLADMRQHFANLIQMMREEGVVEKGHLQVNNNVLILLRDLHEQLLHSDKHPFYSAAYYKALPFIVELRQRSHTQMKSEIENCFEAMYGLLLLRLQGKTVSPETQQAMKAISDFLSQLAAFYRDEKNGELDL